MKRFWKSTGLGEEGDSDFEVHRGNLLVAGRHSELEEGCFL